MIPLPFHSYRLRAKKAAQTRLLNCFATAMPPEGRSPVTVQGIPGIRSFSTITATPQRAAISFNNVLHCVAGDGFYSVDQLGNETLIGLITPGAKIDIGKNVGQVAILSEPYLWAYDGTTLAQVTDTDFTSRGAKRMAVLDSYGGFVEPNSGRFFVCDLADFTVYDPLDFATAESYPDNLLSIESTNLQFVLFGEETIELWENVGGAGFPFSRIPNGIVQNGLGAERSTCTADNTVYWIDQDRIARRLEGNIPRRISHEGVEEQWQTYASISDAYSYSYAHDGRTVVVFTFPSAGATWVYDINTQEWHERESYGNSVWRAAWVLKCYDKTLVGDTNSGNIGEIHSATYTEWGNELLREATSGVIYDEKREIFHDRLEVDMEVGRGTAEVMLDVSDNGGVSFDSLPSRQLGATGEYKTTVDWNRLGMCDERVYRFRVTDAVPFNIYAARLDAR